MESAACSRSLVMWLLIKMLWRSSWINSINRSSISLRTTGSSPAVASSSTSSSGSCASAVARFSFKRMPRL